MDAEWAPKAQALPASVQRGLDLLRKAADYALDVDCDVWQFAVEIRRLQEAGLSNCDLRWLLARRMMSSAREVTQPSDEQRRFITQDGLGLSADTCFVLGSGVVPNEPLPPVAERRAADEGAATLRPMWDSSLRELRVGEALVKRYRVPAPNQELILSAFHEEDWTRRIDDPLPQVPNISPKRRLQAAIMCLNRNQRARLIRFRGNGRGDGVRWELYPSSGG